MALASNLKLAKLLVLTSIFVELTFLSYRYCEALPLEALPLDKSFFTASLSTKSIRSVTGSFNTENLTSENISLLEISATSSHSSNGGTRATSKLDTFPALAKISSNINNSDSSLLQAIGQFNFAASLKLNLLNLDCSKLSTSSPSQTSEIIHLFSLGGIAPCDLEALAISDDKKLFGLKRTGGLVSLGELPFEARVADYSAASGRLAVYDGSSIKILEEGIETRELELLKARPYEIAFSPEGDAILVGGADSIVYRWKFIEYENAESNKERDLSFERYIGHSTVISGLAYHPFGRIAFSGDWKGGMNVWLFYDSDQFGGKYDDNKFWGRGFIEKTNRKKIPREAQLESVEKILISGDGEYVFLALKDGKIEVWQVRGMKRAGQFQA
ncbi:MAG: hypothetical protein KDD56_05520, partial [Bdellovibrionales bacterium]|nr:hypothetical protein [Bdellovibrionales bacterium]